MHMRSAMALATFYDVIKALSDYCCQIAEKSMNDATAEIYDVSKLLTTVVNTKF